MIKVCKVTIITERNSYIRRIAGTISNVMSFIDKTLVNNRQLIGIPSGEKIIEVKYNEYND
jgi:hypothetical protein